MKEISSPRVIDEVVLVSPDLSSTIHTLKTIFHHEIWTTNEVTDSSGKTLYREGINIMNDRKAIRVIEPVSEGTIYDSFLKKNGAGIFGVRERLSENDFLSLREHLFNKGVCLTTYADGVMWADLTETLGGYFGFIKDTDDVHPLAESINLRQFCIVTDNVERCAEILKEYLFIGPTEIGHSNSRTVTNPVNSDYPDGLPEFSFLAGMNFYSNMEFEIVQPEKGPLAYFDFLKRRGGTGFHHIKTEVADGKWQETLDYYYSLGIKDALNGKIGTCGFSNLLTEDMLGFVYELSDGAPMVALPEGYDPYFYPQTDI